MAKQKNTPMLSIGMIVKNESRCLERCLQALQPLRKAIACQLVIADTGSTDGTREIAARYADEVLDFVWINDFSAARNAVLDRCVGQWYMTVDADEYLDENIKELVAFLQSDQAKQYETAYLMQRNYAAQDLTSTEFVDFQANRLLNCSTGVRYTGVIHESFNFQHEKIKGCMLGHTILHHDGYARTTAEEKESYDKKYKRNQQILKEKLKVTPDDITILQCIESNTGEDQLMYARMALEKIKERNYTLGKAVVGHKLMGVLFCRGVSILLQVGDSTADWWLEKLEEYYADSVMRQLDVAFLATLYYQKKGNSEKTIHYAEQYLSTLHTYLAKTCDMVEFRLSPAAAAYPRNKLQLMLVLAGAYGIKHVEKAMSLLDTLAFDVLLGNPKEVVLFFKRLLQLQEEVRTQEITAKFFDQLSSLQDSLPEQETKRIAENFFDQCVEDRQKTKSYRLFLKTNGDFGAVARLLVATDPTEIQQCADEVVDWATLPPQVYHHFIKQSVPLPASLETLPIATRKMIAKTFAVDPTHVDALLAWVTKDHLEGSPIKLQLCYECTAYLLQQGGFTVYQWDLLCRLYLLLSQAMLGTLYQTSLLAEEESWVLLPKHHYFSMVLCQGQILVTENKMVEFMQLLRKGLEMVPQMQHFVGHLQEHAVRLFAPPAEELLGIATQVQTIFQAYPADNPAVQQIKGSEVYQQVAHLMTFQSLEELGF